MSTDEGEFRLLVVNQLMEIKQEIGKLQGKSVAWGAVAGASVSIIGFMVEVWFRSNQ